MAAWRLLAAASVGAAIWLVLQPLLARQLDRSRQLRQWQQRVLTADNVTGRGHGWMALAIGLGVLLGLTGLGWWQTVALAIVAFRGPALLAQAAANREQEQLAVQLPTVWLLFAACQQAGLGVRQSVKVLADGLTGSAGACLAAVQTALAAGQPVWAAGRAAGGASEFLHGWELLVRAEALGSPVGPLLRRLAAQAAAELRWRRQAALARLPLWLTIISVCCFLPGVLVVTVLPQVLSFMAQMG